MLWMVAAVFVVGVGIALAVAVLLLGRRPGTLPGSNPHAPLPAEHAVLVHFAFDGTDLPPVFAIEDGIERALAGRGVGELDGNEVGGGTCVLFLYGPDADALLAAIEPVLRADPLTTSARVVRRYGPADDPGA